MARFKRKNAELEDTKALIAQLRKNPNIPSSMVDSLEAIVADYVRCTFNEWDERHDFYADVVDDMVNDCGFRDDALAEKMANNHPTLQQSFMRMCAKFIGKMAIKSYADARNQSSVDFAKEVVEKVGDKHFPFI